MNGASVSFRFADTVGLIILVYLKCVLLPVCIHISVQQMF